MLGRFGGREPVEVGTGGLSGREDGFLHLSVLSETTVDLKVGVVFIVLLGDQGLFSELRYLGLIVR